jgi:hypothetical protein
MIRQEAPSTLPPDATLRDARRWRNFTYLQPGLRHELAGPQNALALHVQLVARAVENAALDPERLARWSGVLLEELEKLQRLVDLAMGFLSPDRPDPRNAPVASTIAAVVALLEPRARELGVRIVTRASESGLAPLSGRDLEDLLLDLGVDALMRHEEGGEAGFLGWTAREEEGELVLALEDDAPRPPDLGAAPPDPATRFETDATARPLDLARRLVHDSGGGWRLERGPDGGHRTRLGWPAPPKEGTAC